MQTRSTMIKLLRYTSKTKYSRSSELFFNLISFIFVRMTFIHKLQIIKLLLGYFNRAREREKRVEWWLGNSTMTIFYGEYYFSDAYLHTHTATATCVIKHKLHWLNKICKHRCNAKAFRIEMCDTNIDDGNFIIANVSKN